MAQIITVSALNTYVHSLLEGDENLAGIAVKGEVSSFIRNAKSGHCYFSLVDENAGIKAVLFRNDASRLGFQLEDGMHIVVRGRVTLYEKTGAYQMVVQHVFPDGEGALRAAFEQMKARLEQQGLFDAAHKKPLPKLPRRVGLVTSKSGAALQDILMVTQRRYPLAQYLLAPVSVQGMDAAPGIASAVRALDQTGDVDVIIVARGGGSSEDLWVYNSEDIAWAVYEAATPVVSAIGHEIDFTILDFVADVRASTPSAAAEIVWPDLRVYRDRLDNLCNELVFSIHQRHKTCYNTLDSYTRSAVGTGLRKTAQEKQQQLRGLTAELTEAAQKRFRLAARELAASAQLAASLNPFGVLARGYSLARTNGRVLKSAVDAQVGDAVTIQLADGFLESSVTEVRLAGGDGNGKKSAES